MPLTKKNDITEGNRTMNTNVANETISYLTFLIDNNVFALPVNQVQNIVEMSRVSKTHDTHNNIWGFIAQRGTTIPVLDKRMKLGARQNQYTDNTCVVVVQIEYKGGTFLAGIIVDALQEVSDVKVSDIIYDHKKNDLLGIQKREGKENLHIIYPEYLFTTEEIELYKHFIPE